MDKQICIATLTGPGVKPLLLQARSVSVSSDNVFTIQAFWDFGLDFISALNLDYDHLSVAWYDSDKPTAKCLGEVTYTAYGMFHITGTLTMENHLSLSLANIVLEPRQAVHA